MNTMFCLNGLASDGPGKGVLRCARSPAGFERASSEPGAVLTLSVQRGKDTDSVVGLSGENEGFVELTDGVIRLRCLTLADAAGQVAGEDADWIRWFSGGPGSIEGVSRWIQKNRDEWINGGSRLNWAVLKVSSGELVGNVEANLAQEWLEAGEVNISYGVFARHRGQGIALRAVDLVCQWLARDRADALVAVIQVEPENVHSMQIPRTSNFVESGRSRDEHGVEMIRFTRSLQ